MGINMQQNNYGEHTKGVMIGKMRDYFDGGSITVGLSIEDTKQFFQMISKLQEKDRQQLEGLLQQIKEAKAEDEKKGLARKAAEFIGKRCAGIFDSLMANLIIAMSKASQ